MERDGRVGRQRLQFLCGVIHKALDVIPVELARDNREVALAFCGARAGRSKRRHFSNLTI